MIGCIAIGGERDNRELISSYTDRGAEAVFSSHSTAKSLVTPFHLLKDLIYFRPRLTRTGFCALRLTSLRVFLTQVARRFGCSSVTGVDIDPVLIERAAT